MTNASLARQCVDLLVVVLVAVVLCGVIVLTPFSDALPVTVLSLSLVLFLPGYAILAALFPEDGAGPVKRAEQSDTGVGFYPDSGIDMIERLVFSIVVSVLVTPLLGLLLNTTPYGLRRGPVAITLAGVVMVGAAIGVKRRVSLPPDERFDIWPYVTELRRGTAGATGPTIMMNGVIIVCLLIAISGAMYATQGADQGETLTEFYLLSEGDDGELVNEIPEQFGSGDVHSIYVGVGNLEQRFTTYIVVVQLERVDHDSGQVVEIEEIDRYEISLDHGEESVDERQIRPTMEGERIRLAVFLYKDSAPTEPAAETAYRDVYAWIDIVEE